MCRLLAVRAEKEFDIVPELKNLADISKNSKEYQGHGWGCAYLQNNEWIKYKNLKPIWEDDFSQFGKTRLLVAHARSAFKDKGIALENNMPFYHDDYAFIFNGELRGVKIKEEGRIGAEKIFNFIFRFDKNGILDAIKKAVQIIKKSSEYIRAMNFIIADKERLYVSTMFNENPDYFTMYFTEKNGEVKVCSDPYPNENWEKIENKVVNVF